MSRQGPQWANQAGLTLVELTTTVVVASLAAAIMLGAYTMVSRSCAKYEASHAAQSAASAVCRRLALLIRASTGVAADGEHRWIMHRGTGRSVVVERKLDTLTIDGREAAAGGCAVRFECVGSPNARTGPVWSCAVACSTRGSSRTVRWRSVPLGYETPEGLPPGRMTLSKEPELNLTGERSRP